MGGERDLAQYLQTVPGVTFTGDQGGQLFIRGGSNVQTLSLMDGMMVYNPFHSLGLFSVFDTDILKNVDVYTASFPSEYGGRTSSVIDVRTIDGNKNKIGGKIGVNPFSAKAILEGPIYKGKNGGGITFLGSFRNSYLKQTSPVIYPYANESGKHLPFSFRDTYGKLTFHGDNGNKASLFGFNFTDGADLGKLGRFSWNSSGAGANFILVPFVPHPLSYEGLRQLMRVLFKVISRENRALKIAGFLPVMSSQQIRQHHTIRGDVSRQFGASRVLQGIRNDIALAESFAVGRPIRYHAPNSRGAKDFADLAQGILALIETQEAIVINKAS
jgi:hypothetical protein